MANTAIKQFNFYNRYLWEAADFDNFQSGFTDEYRGLAEIFAGAYSNLEISLLTGLGFQAASGIVAGGRGRLLTLGTATSGVFTSPSGNPAKSLVVLRPTSTDVDSIPNPEDPFSTVLLHRLLGASLVIINGTPAASPSYPATVDGDAILFGVTLTASQSTLSASNFDYDIRTIPQFDLYKKNSRGSRIIGGGAVVYAPSLNLQSGHVWSGPGDIHAPGTITGTGTLSTTGTIYS